MPVFSIIMPVYNESGNLSPTISSVINQTFTDFELIIVNDGSTDETIEELIQLTQNNNQIKVYCIENGGISNALNYGLTQVTSRYIARIDAGDVASVNWLELMYSTLMADTAVDIVFGRIFLTNSEYEPFTIWPLWVPRNTCKAILNHRSFPHPFMVAKTTVITEAGGYPSADGYEDSLLWHNLAQKNKKFQTIKTIVGLTTRSKNHNDIVEKRLKLKANLTQWTTPETNIAILKALTYRKTVYNTGLNVETTKTLKNLSREYPSIYALFFLKCLLVKILSWVLIRIKKSPLEKIKTQ